VLFDLVEADDDGDLQTFVVRCTVADGKVVWGTPWQP